MDFLKIQVTKKNTLNIVFKDDAGNIVTVVGGNIIHKDLKACMNALIPHIAFLTEQREVENRKLSEVEADRMHDGNSRSVFKLLTVDTITLNDERTTVTLAGNRILQSGMIIKIESPQLGAIDHERYDYCNELFLAVEAVCYEAEQYYTQQKWGIKEGSLYFAADDPFEGKVTSDQVPQADISEGKKRGRKAKKEKAA